MKRNWIFLSVVTLLVLCVMVLALLVAMNENDQPAGAQKQQATEQLEGQQEGQTADQQEEQSSDQQAIDQQAIDQQDQQGAGGGQSGQGGNNLADLERALHGQVEIYHGAELDTSEGAVNEMNETGEWILLTREAPDKVVQFYDRELRGTRDLAKQEGDGGASYSFRTREGKAVTLDIEPAGSTQREGTRITITIGD